MWRAVDAAGVERTRIERGRRRPATVSGKVTVTRIARRGTGVEDLHPADAALNPPSGMHAHGLARPAAIEATRGTFAEARERVDAVTGAGVGHRQIQELVLAAAAGIDAFYDALAPAPCTDTTPLILSAGGLGVVMRAGKGSADAGLAGTPATARTPPAALRASATAPRTPPKAPLPAPEALCRHAMRPRRRMAENGPPPSAPSTTPTRARTVDEVIAAPGRSAAVAAGPPAVRQPGPRPGPTQPCGERLRRGGGGRRVRPGRAAPPRAGAAPGWSWSTGTAGASTPSAPRHRTSCRPRPRARTSVAGGPVPARRGRPARRNPGRPDGAHAPDGRRAGRRRAPGGRPDRSVRRRAAYGNRRGRGLSDRERRIAARWHSIGTRMAGRDRSDRGHLPPSDGRGPSGNGRCPAGARAAPRPYRNCARLVPTGISKPIGPGISSRNPCAILRKPTAARCPSTPLHKTLIGSAPNVAYALAHCVREAHMGEI